MFFFEKMKSYIVIGDVIIEVLIFPFTELMANIMLSIWVKL